MSHTLDALSKPNVKEAIFAGLDVYTKTNNQQSAVDAAVQRGTENGAVAEVATGAFLDIAESVIRFVIEYERKKKE